MVECILSESTTEYSPAFKAQMLPFHELGKVPTPLEQGFERRGSVEKGGENHAHQLKNDIL